MVHVVFAVRSALKHSVFHRLLGPKFRANFLKNRFLSLDVMQRGAGGSGDNVHLTLFVEKSICDSSLREPSIWEYGIKDVGIFCDARSTDKYNVEVAIAVSLINAVHNIKRE